MCKHKVYISLHSNEEIGTPLTCAAKNGHEQIVDYLITSGADKDGLYETVRIAMGSRNVFLEQR